MADPATSAMRRAGSGAIVWGMLLILAGILAIVEGEDEVGPFRATQSPMRPGLPLHDPSQPQQRRQYSARLGRRPMTQAAATEIEMEPGSLSECSKRSARTRSASTWTRAMASSLVQHPVNRFAIHGTK